MCRGQYSLQLLFVQPLLNPLLAFFHGSPLRSPKHVWKVSVEIPPLFTCVVCLRVLRASTRVPRIPPAFQQRGTLDESSLVEFAASAQRNLHFYGMLMTVSRILFAVRDSHQVHVGTMGKKRSRRPDHRLSAPGACFWRNMPMYYETQAVCSYYLRFEVWVTEGPVLPK